MAFPTQPLASLKRIVSLASTHAAAVYVMDVEREVGVKIRTKASFHATTSARSEALYPP